MTLVKERGRLYSTCISFPTPGKKPAMMSIAVGLDGEEEKVRPSAPRNIGNFQEVVFEMSVQ